MSKEFLKTRPIDKKTYMVVFQERMKRFMFHKKCKSKRQFALRYGFSAQRFTLYMKKGNEIIPSWDFGIQLKTACPELNMNWLFTGQGKMIEENVQRKDRPEGLPYYF